MNSGLYVRGESRLHHLPASLKLVVLCLAGSTIVMLHDWRLLAIILVGIVLLFRLACIPPRTILAQLRPLLWLIAVIFLVQLFLSGWRLAFIVACRLLDLIMLSTLLTLTTSASAMIEAMERLLLPLRRVGVDPEKVALALSLAIRFVPVIARIASEVREAQWARGMDRSALALIVPLIVRTLKMADEVAEAIDARSCGSSAPVPIHPPRE